MKRIVSAIVVMILMTILVYFIFFKHRPMKYLKNNTIIIKTNKQVSINNLNISISPSKFKKINETFNIPRNITPNDIVRVSNNNGIINPVLRNYLIDHISILKTDGSIVVPGGLIYPTKSIFGAYAHIENGDTNLLITEDFIDYLFVYSQTEILYYIVEKYLYDWLYELLNNDLRSLIQLYQNGDKYALVPMIYDAVALKILNDSFVPPEQIKGFVEKYVYLIKKAYGYYLLPSVYNDACYKGFDLIETNLGLRIDLLKNLSKAMECMEELPSLDYAYYKDYLNRTMYGRFILALLWLGNSRFSLNDSDHVKIALTWLYSLEVCKNDCLNLWYRLYKTLTIIFSKQDLLSPYYLYTIVKTRLNNDLDLKEWFDNWKYFKSNKGFSLFSINHPYPTISVYKSLTYPNINGDSKILIDYYDGRANLSDVLPRVRILPNALDIVVVLDPSFLNEYIDLYDLGKDYEDSVLGLNRNLSKTLFVVVLDDNLKTNDYYPSFMKNDYQGYKRIITTLGTMCLFESMIFRTRFEKPHPPMVLRNDVYVLVLPYFGLIQTYYNYFTELINYFKKIGINDEKLMEYLSNIANIFEELLTISELEFYHGKLVKNFDIIDIYKKLNTLNNIALGPLFFKTLEYYGYKAYYYGAMNGLNYEILILKSMNGYMVFIGPVFNYYDFYSNRIVQESYWEEYVSESIERPKIYSLIGLSYTKKDYLTI